MTSNSFGRLFRFTTWGESHGPAIGCVIDGVPPLIPLTEADIQIYLDKRKPGQSRFTTQRQEPDTVRILSGVFEGKTTGTSISLVIENQDQRSKDYGDIKDKFRPGHADYTYEKKYGIRDYRGGGRSSARETATRVAGLRKLVVPEPHVGEPLNEVIWHLLPPALPPVPHLAVVPIEDVLDVVDVGFDARSLLRGLEGLNCQRRPPVAEHGIWVCLAEGSGSARGSIRLDCIIQTRQIVQLSGGKRAHNVPQVPLVFWVVVFVGVACQKGSRWRDRLAEKVELDLHA